MELEQAVGRTPAVRLRRLADGMAEVWVKLEAANPAGSVKDRTALAMVAGAEERGLLQPGRGQVIVEATSGNTGIGLAMIAAARGYRYVNVATESLSAERRSVLLAYGAELDFVPDRLGLKEARSRARELAFELEGWWADQFSNPDNPLAHYRTTAPEAWEQLGGKVDALVLGTGTGGTLSGVARYLKERNPRLRVVALEPEPCQVLQGGTCGGHPFVGLAPGFVPETLDRSLMDEVLPVPVEPALELGLRLARDEGLLLGPSSMANAWGAIRVAAELGAGKRVLTLAPDSGLKYLNSPPYGS
ncbi:PLP-dependent cysteine synthase family protein [Oceanithermus sp.]